MAAPCRLLPLVAAVGFFLFGAGAADTEGCQRGCNLALGSYAVSLHDELVEVAPRFNISDYSDILRYNPSMTDVDMLFVGERISIHFRCDCIGNSYLAGIFLYNATENDTYETIARIKYSNLTTVDSLIKGNPHPLAEGNIVRVEVNCSCGDESMPSDYTVFMTYPMGPMDNISAVAERFNVSTELMDELNPGALNSDRIIFIPVKGLSAVNGSSPLSKTREFSGAAITGIVVGIVVAVISLAICYHVFHYKRRQARETKLLLSASRGTAQNGVTNDISLKFTYEEIAEATCNFNLARKIGEGGFGSVYCAELKGERTAIKKMNMMASQEFLAELQVLSRVYHVNLVRLIGYCIESSLILVYEYIDNGNLGQHLRGSDWEPLRWPARVQIALDSAKGLQYIHEYTVPAYVHRDVKSSNILIDNNLRAKLADFGLTKNAKDAENTSRIAGTWGYMPPEYAGSGIVTQKVDVYAFGVVLYELVSAKEVIIEANEPDGYARTLVSLFEEAFAGSNQKECLDKLVDTRLASEWPFDSVLEMVLLARACTHRDPERRPTMTAVVVKLMAILTISNYREEIKRVPLYIGDRLCCY